MQREGVVARLEQFKPREDELKERNRVTLEEVGKSERAIDKFQNDIRQKNMSIGQLKNQSAQEKPVTVGVLEEDLDRERDKLESLETQKRDAETKFREQEEVATRAKEVFDQRKREVEEKLAQRRVMRGWMK